MYLLCGSLFRSLVEQPLNLRSTCFCIWRSLTQSSNKTHLWLLFLRKSLFYSCYMYNFKQTIYNINHPEYYPMPILNQTVYQENYLEPILRTLFRAYAGNTIQDLLQDHWAWEPSSSQDTGRYKEAFTLMKSKLVTGVFYFIHVSTVQLNGKLYFTSLSYLSYFTKCWIQLNVLRGADLQ